MISINKVVAIAMIFMVFKGFDFVINSVIQRRDDNNYNIHNLKDWIQDTENAHHFTFL